MYVKFLQIYVCDRGGNIPVRIVHLYKSSVIQYHKRIHRTTTDFKMVIVKGIRK